MIDSIYIVPVRTYEVCVIKLGNRFYAGHTKKRIKTAWTLAGAKLFLVDSSPNQPIHKVGEMLISKGYNPTCKTVTVQD
jgi:hypothetical protein